MANAQLIKNLLAMRVSKEELLAAGQYRDNGTLARLSRHQLANIVDIEFPNGLPHEKCVSIARFTVERALLAHNGATPSRLRDYDVKAEEFVSRIISNHVVGQTTNAQRRAAKMTDATETTNVTTNGKTQKFANTKTASKKAATKAPAKKAAKKAAKDTPEVGVSRYADDQRKIKVLIKENPHREATGRAAAFDAVKESKTVADYAATGNKPKYLADWVERGHISLT